MSERQEEEGKNQRQTRCRAIWTSENISYIAHTRLSDIPLWHRRNWTLNASTHERRKYKPGLSLLINFTLIIIIIIIKLTHQLLMRT